MAKAYGLQLMEGVDNLQIIYFLYFYIKMSIETEHLYFQIGVFEI